MSTAPPPSPRQVAAGFTVWVAAACLLIYVGGLARLAYDVGGLGVLTGLGLKLGVLAVVYLLGLALGAVGQGRGSVPAFGTVARAFGWANLALASFTYLVITFRLLGHDYSAWQYGAFALILLAQLIAAGGLHVVSPARAVAIFAFPLLATVLFHLALVVYQVVFRSEPFSLYLVGDLALLLAMAL